MTLALSVTWAPYLFLPSGRLSLSHDPAHLHCALCSVLHQHPLLHILHTFPLLSLLGSFFFIRSSYFFVNSSLISENPTGCCGSDFPSFIVFQLSFGIITESVLFPKLILHTPATYMSSFLIISLIHACCCFTGAILCACSEAASWALQDDTDALDPSYDALTDSSSDWGSCHQWAQHIEMCALKK